MTRSLETPSILVSPSTSPAAIDLRMGVEHSDHTAKLASFANRCIDFSLLSVLFIASLVLAGRHPVGRLALMLAILPGTLGLVLKVLAGRKIPLTNLQFALMVLCLAVPTLQVIPFPSQWINQAAPGIERLFGPDTELASSTNFRNTFSLSDATTRRSLPMIVSYLCFFAFLVIRLDCLASMERVFAMIMGSAVLITVVALLQAHFGNGKFLWVYDHPSRLPENIPRGPFQNENHLSSLLATALPVILYFLFRAPHANANTFSSVGGHSSRSHAQRHSHHRSSKHHPQPLLHSKSLRSILRVVAAIACVTIVCTVFATPSRGGAVIIAFAACLWPGIIGWRWIGSQYVSRVSPFQWLSIGATLCLGVIAYAGWALSQTIEQWSYWRAKLWAADFQIWRDFPLFGIGIGNHPHVYRAYLDEYVAVTFSTGESSWLQFLVETGLVGTLLAIFIVSVVFYTILRNLSVQMHLSHTMMLCASLAGLLASCTHATIDFPWHIPACFITVLALVAVAIRLPHFLSHAPKAVRPTLFDTVPSLSIAIAGLLLMGNLWAISSAIPSARAARSWDDYRRIVRDQPEDRDSADSKDEIALLTQTLRLDPYHILARVKLTHYLAAELDRRRAQLQNSPELANTVLKQASLIATICPTESRSYLYASSAFAALDAPLAKQQLLLSQSQRLRLVDGRVALRLGVNALLAQDQALVDQQFTIALNQDPSYVEHVVGILSVLYPFDEILNRWHPNRNSTAVIFNQARQKGTADQLKKVGQYYCLRLAEDAEREISSSNRDHLLESALVVAKQVNDRGLQLQMANLRIVNQPQNVSLLLERAVLFIMQDDHESAKQDLQRARDISPHDSRIRQVAYQIDKANRPSLR